MAKQGVKKKFKSFLKGIDSFGQPILLSYKGKTSYSTWLGGLLTISLITLIVAFSFEATVSLLVRENIKVAFSEIYETDPYPVQVSGRKGFYLAMGLQPDKLNNQTRKHFEIKANQRINRRLKNGTIEYTYIEIKLKKCEAENFPPGYDFVKYNQQNWLCPDVDLEMFLEGKHQSEFFKFLQITVEKCDNVTNNNTCAPPEESEEIMKVERIYMNFAFSNKIINLQDYNNPYSDFMESSTFFIIDPRKYYKQVDLFFMNNTIVRDDDLWFYHSSKSSEVTFDNFREQVMDVTSNRYAAFFFRSSFKRGQYLASSEKLTLMLARLGGLISVIYSFVEIIARLYNRKKLLVSLANHLYNFVLSGGTGGRDQNKSPEGTQVLSLQTVSSQMNAKRIFFRVNHKDESKSEKELSTKAERSLPNVIEVVSPDKSPAKSEDQASLLVQIQSYLKKFPKIRFNPLFNVFRNKQGDQRAEQREILRKALKRVDKDVDITNILKKSKEIDKVKDFLFDEQQRILFEFFPKPVISVGISKKITPKKSTASKSSPRRYTSDFIKKLLSQKGKINEEEAYAYIELYNAFLVISAATSQNDKTNSKLISFLGTSILNIFRRHQMKSIDV